MEEEREKDNCFFPSVFLQRREKEGGVVSSSFVPSNENRQHKQTGAFFFPHFDSGFWGVEFRREKPYCWI
jgi:hypothetical protein